MVSTGIMVLAVIIALVIGVVGGFFMARKYMETYLKKNPPISEEMIRSMMISMGQTPSQKRLNQVMASMRNRKD
ncbi:YneF family protein [Periweissella beninensis]|uniref:UPF0154 protein KAK10_01130 n=1 Tax=Periweissella beninensis TaxID=504936 RepID=A0ABT0VI04_9LACO|nr:YneF family protein [Periweissella beninensis]MBM7543557.1 uncharacterized protein YneF (UPF0154 family) [Periweissella beninensis]MCM2436539.1 YneF family protein [Periweissella beninensis]MCT4396256.1 YneF family protein [Periweissella beninensis]